MNVAADNVVRPPMDSLVDRSNFEKLLVCHFFFAARVFASFRLKPSSPALRLRFLPPFERGPCSAGLCRLLRCLRQSEPSMTKEAVTGGLRRRTARRKRSFGTLDT